MWSQNEMATVIYAPKFKVMNYAKEFAWRKTKPYIIQVYDKIDCLIDVIIEIWCIDDDLISYIYEVPGISYQFF